ncbi:MAG: hypothetical protein C0624_01015 [Desulfuromonas sp.]|nr:MAG: hypothetical protein C0624_01015 [Desulfuromonas sp.]
MRVLLLLLLLSLPLQAQAAIYKWVDANGVVTFKDTPPPQGVRSERIETNPSFDGSEQQDSTASSTLEAAEPADALQGSEPLTPAEPDDFFQEDETDTSAVADDFLQESEPDDLLQESEPVTSAVPAPQTVLPESFPRVELYVTSGCPACRQAKAYLRSMKVPFMEYDVKKSSRAAKKHAQLNPSLGVPVAVIGGNKILGFNQGAYEQALGINR